MRDLQHPFWEVHDTRRTARYYSKIYEDRSTTIARTIFWKDSIIALFASGSAISGFVFFANGHQGAIVWLAGTFLAAVISTVSPFLQLNEKYEHSNEMLYGFRDLEAACEMIIFDVQTSRRFNDVAVGRFKEVLTAKAKIYGKKRPLALSEKKKKAYQTAVDTELPADTLYIPSI
jgi:hypothetical protein